MTFLVFLFIALLAFTPQVPPGWPRFAYILALGSLATCIVVWNGRRPEVKSQDEWKAEKEAREALAEQHVAEMKRRGQPWTV